MGVWDQHAQGAACVHRGGCAGGARSDEVRARAAGPAREQQGLLLLRPL